MQPEVKLMIEAGIVPNNAIQQLIKWKLLPEGADKMAGSHQVCLESKWEKIGEFIEALEGAIDRKDSVIQETNFSSWPSGEVEFDIVPPGSGPSGVLHYTGKMEAPSVLTLPCPEHFQSPVGTVVMAGGYYDVVGIDVGRDNNREPQLLRLKLKRRVP
jgi:hypothetical protein